MCDARGNAVVVCSIENLDPMGVHTGDSWTIAPQQTLPDPVYQQLREAAFATARAVGVATGGANVQFAVHPESGEFRVIEMNPRVSRSSALASKATGFPIAKLAALLAVGYTLDELPNDITGKTTAAFEPALDYVAVKAPRFDFEKFPLASRRLGAEMRAVGEALGLGRTFAEAFMKAMDGREAPPVPFPADDGELLARAAEPLPERWDLLLECARRGLEPPGIHPYFADPPARGRRRETRMLEASRSGLPSTPAPASSRRGRRTTTSRTRAPTRGPEPSGRAVIVLGGGPNRIGQAIEFDYCCVHAAQALQKLGYEAVLVNSNPETVSTDYDTSDRLYLEPLVERNVLDVCELEQPVGVAVSFGGQTPLRLAPALAAAGVPLLGDPLDAIDAAEDRGRFAKLAGDLAPEWGVADERRGGARGRTPDRLSGARAPAPRDRRARHARRALRRRAARRGPVPRRPLSRRARSSSTSTRSATARAPGSPPCSSTSSRPASTRATPPACCPGPSVSAALEAEIREVATRHRRRARRARPDQPPARAARAAGSGCWRRTRAPRGPCRSSPRRPACRSSSTPCGCCSASRLRALDLPERAVPSRAWAKEAVFPAERFPGAATRGPEMRSTGEVMAGAATAVRGVPARAPRRRPVAARRRDRPAAAGRRRYPRAAMRRASSTSIDAPTRPARRRRSRPSSTRFARRRASRARRWSSPRAAGSSARSPAAASRPTSPSAPRRSSPAARRERRPLRRRRQRGVGGRPLLRRRDRRLARAGRPRASGTTFARCSMPTGTGCSTRTPRRVRSGSSAACSRAPACARTASSPR